MTKKKYSKKNRRNFVAIPFTASIALTTLADDVVLATPLLGSGFNENLYAISVDATWSLKGHTQGEVPIQFGFCHDDLSVSEIAENLSAELTDPDDIITKERAQRPVRKSGIFSKGGENEQQLQDGALVRTKLKFMIGEGHSLALWIQNRTGNTLTTGSVVECNGTIYGRWRR